MKCSATRDPFADHRSAVDSNQVVTLRRCGKVKCAQGDWHIIVGALEPQWAALARDNASKFLCLYLRIARDESTISGHDVCMAFSLEKLAAEKVLRSCRRDERAPNNGAWRVSFDLTKNEIEIEVHE